MPWCAFAGVIALLTRPVAGTVHVRDEDEDADSAVT